MAHSDPTLLYSVKGIKAYHIQGGDESDLTPSGPQTLSLLMVPIESAYGDSYGGQEEDFYLHLSLPPELDMSLPATTQIYHKPPHSYLIPRWDLGPETGAFTRIEFPPLGRGVTQEDVDTFETILAQCTAFLERAAPPDKSVKGYNPAAFKPGEGYVAGTASGSTSGSALGSGKHGQIVLVDEDNGSVVGEVAEGATFVESPLLKPGYKGKDDFHVQHAQCIG
jgi:spartin